ncbi:MAG: flagellar motor protein MotB, partial [Burkholderiales bacterium]|nr:flagellar motor protein MotB [Burkholderiales bacterium]
KGIADYFASPLKVALLGGGSGSGDSSSVIKGGGEDLTRSTGQVKRGDVKAKKSTIDLHELKAEQIRAERQRLEQLKTKVEAKIDANTKLAAMKSQIQLEMTPDGLRIQIVDQDGKPMFASGSASVEPNMRELLRTIGSVLAEVPNRLTLEGHTDSLPFGSTERGYSNWELSADRANASRRELVAGGLPEDQVLRVQGLAASNPYDRRDPTAPANRRISIVVMTREAEERVFRATPDIDSESDAASAPAAAAPPSPAPPPDLARIVEGSSPPVGHR